MSEREGGDVRIPADPRAYAALALLCGLYEVAEMEAAPKTILKFVYRHPAGPALWEQWVTSRNRSPDDPELFREAVKALNEMLAVGVTAGEDRREAVEAATSLLGDNDEPH